MTEVAPMKLPDAGQIDMGQIRTEVAGSGQVSLNDADFRALINKSSGQQQALSDYYGKSSGISQETIDEWNAYCRDNSLGVHPYAGDKLLSGSAPTLGYYYDINPLRQWGAMEGSPRLGRSGNTNVRAEATYNRITQHMVESFDEFKFLEENSLSIMIAYRYQTGISNMLGENFNGYQSTDFAAYGTGYNEFTVIWLAPDGTAKKRDPTGAVTQVNWTTATKVERRLFTGAKKPPKTKAATQENSDE